MGWQPIETAPRDGSEIIVLINSACVPIVRSAWRDDGFDGYSVEDAADIGLARNDSVVGWWSYRHSVTQEMLAGYDYPIAWMPSPDDTCRKWMDVFPPL